MIFIDQTQPVHIVEKILGYTQAQDGRIVLDIELDNGTRDAVTLTVDDLLALAGLRVVED